MLTSEIFTSALLAAAAAFSSGAFANDSDYPGVHASTTVSTVTCAQVWAEYLLAKRGVTLPRDHHSYPVVVADDSGKSWAEAKHELAETQRAGYIPRIDNSYLSEDVGSKKLMHQLSLIRFSESILAGRRPLRQIRRPT